MYKCVYIYIYIHNLYKHTIECGLTKEMVTDVTGYQPNNMANGSEKGG